MGFSFFGLFGQTNKFKTVDVAEFAKAVADTSYVVLDVRTQAEHAEGHIPGCPKDASEGQAGSPLLP